MTEKEVDILFANVVNDKKLMKKHSFSKHQLHNWRHPERQTTSLGAKLEVLMITGHLRFENVVVTTTDIHPLK